MKPTLGVFGLGQFMKFFTPHLLPYFDIKIYDRTGKRGEEIYALQASPVNMQEAAECDYVLLGYPAGSIRELLENISSFVMQDAVVFDVCSVKTPAVEAMIDLLPQHCNIISTHPVFGPQSGKDGIEDLQITLSAIRCTDESYNFFKDLFSKKMKLQLVEIGYDEHDREMAYVLGMSHFIGKSLFALNMPKTQLYTKAYNHILEVVSGLGPDSDALFLSIQNDNPYAGDVRKSLMEEFAKKEAWLEDNKS